MSRARDLADGTFSGAFSADSPTLVVDDTNNNVGIGIASPTFTAAYGGVHVHSTYPEIHLTGTDSGSTAGDGFKIQKNSANNVYLWNYENAFVAIGANNTQRARFDSDGLKFGSDTAAANALDDYEEGTFTPSFTASSSNPTVTYAVRVGLYVKVGTMIYVQGRIRTNSVSGGSGVLRISGLPYTANYDHLQNYNAVGVGYTLNWPSGKFPTSGYTEPSSDWFIPLRFWSGTDANGSRSVSFSVGDLGTTTDNNDIIFSMVYRTT